MNSLLYLLTNTNEFQQVTDMDAAWNQFKNAITEACERFIPKINIPRKNYPRWFNASIWHKLNCVHTLRQKLRSNPSATNSRKLQTTESELQSLIESAKDSYLENLTSTFKKIPKSSMVTSNNSEQNQTQLHHTSR